MGIIAYLLGITFFGALAASGYIVTTQILYWIVITFLTLCIILRYQEATRNISRIKNNRKLAPHSLQLLPIIRSVDYDSKSVHDLFSNIFHSFIAFYFLHAPILGLVILVVAFGSIVCSQKYKEMVKYVNNDPRYQ